MNFFDRFDLKLEGFGLAAIAALGLAKADGSRACLRCKGKGEIPARKISDTYTSPAHVCSSCPDRTGWFPSVDADEVRAAIKGRKGLRSARPKWIKGQGFDAMRVSRAYFVWRMARFHGGVDTRMPMAADMDIYGDPFKAELDALADQAAIAYFGSDLRGAMRWGQAMGLY